MTKKENKLILRKSELNEGLFVKYKRKYSTFLFFFPHTTIIGADWVKISALLYQSLNNRLFVNY